MSLEDRLYPVLKVYEACPQWIKNIVGSVYRCIPTSIRYGKKYQHFQQLIEDVYGWDKEKIEAYQLEQLKLSITEAWEYCPYYRQSFERAGVSPNDLKTLDDLKKFPTITKQDIITDEAKMASTRIPEQRRLRITTGGSTGEPVGFSLHRGVSRPKEQAFLEGMWRRIGYDTKCKVAVVRGHVTSKFADGQISYRDSTRNWLILSSYHLSEKRLDEYLTALNEFKPEFLHFYPSAALQLAELLKRTGKSLDFQPQGMLCGSERLPPSQKKILEKAFGCSVYRWYGHAERVVLAGEGSKSNHFYFWPNYGFTELSEPDENGYCEVIGTSFHNMAMPFIRYHTGDYVKPVQEGAELEYPWLAVRSIAGREQEFLLSKTGRKISLTAFNMHDGVFDNLYSVQFYQEVEGEAEFRYVAMEDFEHSQLETIRKAIMTKLGDDFIIKMVKVTKTDKTEAGKNKWLVSSLTPK